ncbi:MULTISPECIES: NYN domain-containing protein [unclassified Bradyrhizobium]|uniref:LabA-like NYN domain-containing protein n=1 Tax=unclassified Bradyrhizobium TaxID=2631580 RepID=UPI00244B2840|nr:MULTISPECIES: NYN domain-containing protein [unclassified Bradyrhizobium]MDH2347619.1 NYN domain-containing protein [Bradyrhizobium sp. SSUT77]MDH2349251.1 NYN domain-containing protein [Bradyrhizobium sp. SSUT112]
MALVTNRIALLIDGANLHATARALGFGIDYKRLLLQFGGRGISLKALFFAAVLDGPEFATAQPLIDWLGYNGYTVVTKNGRQFFDANRNCKIKANMQIELAVRAMELAPHTDELVLFSGDGDFRPLVEAVQRRGVRVTIVSSNSSEPSMVANELRRQADVFIDLKDLRPMVERDSTSASFSAGSAATSRTQR